MYDYDLIVLGGGSAGLTVAAGAGALGAKTLLIDKAGVLGGDCLRGGCVPSKALLKAGKVAATIRHAEQFGLPRAALSGPLDLGKVMGRVQQVIDHIEADQDNPERYRRVFGIDVQFGSGKFIGPHELELDGKVLRSRQFAICTGSRALIPRIEGLDTVDFLTNENIFHLQTLPQHLLVMGGGPIGTEMAQAFARLGSQVTIGQKEPRLLPKDDPELTQHLQTLLEREGLTVLTSAEVRKVAARGTEKVVTVHQQGKSFELVADQILVATGRRPNIEDLNLEAAGVQVGPKGIIVNKKLRTSAPHIYAAGDVIGQYLFTHVAEYHAKILLSNALFKFPLAVNYRVVPWTTFTDPELAHVGITEHQAKAQGLKHVVYKFRFDQVDRALADGESQGLVKLVCRPNGQILGGHILGPQAGELVQQVTLAMSAKLPVSKLPSTIYVYPTLSLGVRRAADAFYEAKLFQGTSARLLKWWVRLWNSRPA